MHIAPIVIYADLKSIVEPLGCNMKQTYYSKQHILCAAPAMLAWLSTIKIINTNIRLQECVLWVLECAYLIKYGVRGQAEQKYTNKAN